MKDGIMLEMELFIILTATKATKRLCEVSVFMRPSFAGGMRLKFLLTLSKAVLKSGEILDIMFPNT